MLRSRLYTVVKTQNGNVQIGTAWVVVQPSWPGASLDETIANQGCFSVNRANVMFGAIGVNARGDAAMGVTLVGRDFFPRAAWVALSEAALAPRELGNLHHAHRSLSGDPHRT